MDGKAMLYALRKDLRESTNSGFLDDRTSYDYIWEAMIDFVSRTTCLPTTQAITTVAEQATYYLTPEYLKLYLKNTDNEYYVKYNDGTSNYFLTWQDYEDIVLADQSSGVSVPNHFSIIPYSSLEDQVNSSATATAAAVGGLSTLNDSGVFDYVYPGDEVHNLSDGSDGVVISRSSTSAISTALFGGTNNDWTSADSYMIQPQSRFKLVLDPPPSTAGHTVTVYFQKRPQPVYHSYGVYAVPAQYHRAIVGYATYKYKYRDSKPQEGDALFRAYDLAVRSANEALRHGLNRGRRLQVSYRGVK